MTRNWNSSYSISNSKVVKVTSESDIVHHVKQAYSCNSRIRAMGSLYNFADIVSPTKSKNGKEIILNLESFSNLVSIDKECKTVTVEAGMKLYELNRILDSTGLSLSNYGNVTGQSIAGVIATGTHGKSVKQGSFSSLVKSLRFVNGYGEIVSVDFTSKEPEMVELANAVGISVGMLGIITQVTLQCEKLYYLRKSEYSVTFDELMLNWDKLHEQGDYVEVAYFPIVDRFTVGISYRLVDDVGRASFQAIRPTIKRNPSNLVGGSNIASVYLFSATASLVDRYSWGRKLIGWIFKMVGKLQPRKDKQRFYASIASDVIADKSNLDIKHKEYEVVVPFDRAKEAIETLRKFFITNPHFITGWPVDLRCARKERFYLSGTHDSDGLWMDFIIPIASIHSFPTKELHKLFKPFNAKRHWGKLSHLKGQEAESAYGENFKKFLDVRLQHDPKGIFRNKILDEIMCVDDAFFKPVVKKSAITTDYEFVAVECETVTVAGA
ncbi:hypothetical protein HDV06_007071 [Boothiomyces sp. JEL0866]|nr:hypothetical protein HDV06_007071 [Boothiomyces sp. JEL0866]